VGDADGLRAAISLAHGEGDIETTITAADLALAEI
jgi:hypothetical protein